MSDGSLIFRARLRLTPCCSSWGATRKIEGDDGEAHGDKDGEFDQSISMKRWHEWERERRIVEASNKTANKRRSMESRKHVLQRHSVVSYSS